MPGVEAEARRERPSDPTRPTDPLIGAHIEGRYIVERIQGRGGTSVVYAGIHEELQREVAIKVLDEASAADPEALERFVFEARMGSSIAHGNVVGVSDFGHLPDGRPFLVMPMIAGTDMATMLAQEGPQHPRRVAALLKGVAAALGLMHARGIVHRDIKSENLMHVAHEDGTETSLVLDFGITAMRVGEVGYEDGSGTPEFMPPEALNGELFDYRGDIYSLATVAFELITGMLPFESEDLADLRKKKNRRPPRRLSESGERDFPPALEAAIARGLSVRPEDRQASANELIREIELAAELVPDRTHEEVASRLKRASSFPTLVGTGAAMSTRVKMRLARTTFGNMKSPAFNALAERAAHFSSSTPPPPPAGSTGAVVLPPNPAVPSPASLVPSGTAAAEAAHWQTEEASFESGVHLLSGRDSDPSPAEPVADSPGARRGALGAQAPGLGDDAALDIDEDVFRRPASGARKFLLIGLAAAAVVGVVMWQRASAPVAAPTAPASPSVAAVAEPSVPANIAPPVPVLAAGIVDRPDSVSASAVTPDLAPSDSAEPALAEAPQEPVPSHAARAKSPAHAPSRRASARDATPRASGRSAAADRVLSVRAKADPDRIRALTDQGTDATLRGDFAAAVNYFQRAIAADAGNAVAWRGKALALERLGRTQDAVVAFRQFLKLSPEGRSADKIRARVRVLESSRR